MDEMNKIYNPIYCTVLNPYGLNEHFLKHHFIYHNYCEETSTTISLGQFICGNGCENCYNFWCK